MENDSNNSTPLHSQRNKSSYSERDSIGTHLRLSTYSGSLYTSNQQKDIVAFIAEEKNLNKHKIKQRKMIWQIVIFSLAFFINFCISFRDYFIQGIIKEEPDSPMTFAINLCKGIGYIIIGNMYDNVGLPKTLTFRLLLLVSAFTILVSIFTY